jgi:regulator of protease activity HflC (stomatin/prohibitin superfamily)
LGNYTARGNIPIVFIPIRSSCLPWIYVPNGAYAIITKNGRFDQIKKEGGMIFCLPWTRIEFLISKQDLIQSYKVKACPTYDNVYVELDLSVLFRCKNDE